MQNLNSSTLQPVSLLLSTLHARAACRVHRRTFVPFATAHVASPAQSCRNLVRGPGRRAVPPERPAPPCRGRPKSTQQGSAVCSIPCHRPCCGLPAGPLQCQGSPTVARTICSVGSPAPPRLCLMRPPPGSQTMVMVTTSLTETASSRITRTTALLMTRMCLPQKPVPTSMPNDTKEIPNQRFPGSRTT
jgi:hypothetical protein